MKVQSFINSQSWLFPNGQAEQEAAQGHGRGGRRRLCLLGVHCPCMVVVGSVGCQQSSPYHSDELLHLELESCKYFCCLDREVPNVGECNKHSPLTHTARSHFTHPEQPNCCGPHLLHELYWCWYFSWGVRRRQHSTIASVEHHTSRCHWRIPLTFWS